MRINLDFVRLVYSLDGVDFTFDKEEEVIKEAKKLGQDYYWRGVLRQKKLGDFFTDSYIEAFLEFVHFKCLNPNFLSDFPEDKLSEVVEIVRKVLNLAYPEPLEVIENIEQIRL